ncbi:hypothetical protein [Streptomyces griseosporeus]|uniref:hypothetical protein n=1 Tax=Streptomyces griseosporeus TaxID=1910 RepID=UPI0037941299
MDHNRRRTAVCEVFDAEIIALLDALEVELPAFGNVDLDFAFGTPLEMYEAGVLPHEQLDGLGVYSAIEAVEARESRLAAARDIAADPAVTALVRERLVDVLVPYVSQLNLMDTHIDDSRGIVSAPLAA